MSSDCGGCFEVCFPDLSCPLSLRTREFFRKWLWEKSWIGVWPLFYSHWSKIPGHSEAVALFYCEAANLTTTKKTQKPKTKKPTKDSQNKTHFKYHTNNKIKMPPLPSTSYFYQNIFTYCFTYLLYYNEFDWPLPLVPGREALNLWKWSDNRSDCYSWAPQTISEFMPIEMSQDGGWREGSWA